MPRASNRGAFIAQDMSGLFMTELSETGLERMIEITPAPKIKPEEKPGQYCSGNTQDRCYNPVD